MTAASSALVVELGEGAPAVRVGLLDGDASESLLLSLQPASVTRLPARSKAVACFRVRTAVVPIREERGCVAVTLSPRTTRCGTTAAPGAYTQAVQIGGRVGRSDALRGGKLRICLRPVSSVCSSACLVSCVFGCEVEVPDALRRRAVIARCLCVASRFEVISCGAQAVPGWRLPGSGDWLGLVGLLGRLARCGRNGMRKTDRPPLFHVWLVVYRAGLELEPCGGWPNGDHVSVEGDAPAGEPATDCVEVFQFVVPNPLHHPGVPDVAGGLGRSGGCAVPWIFTLVNRVVCRLHLVCASSSF